MTDTLVERLRTCGEPCPQCNDRIDALSAADVLERMK